MYQIEETSRQYKPKELMKYGFSQLKRTAGTVHGILTKLDSTYREARLLGALY